MRVSPLRSLTVLVVVLAQLSIGEHDLDSPLRPALSRSLVWAKDCNDTNDGAGDRSNDGCAEYSKNPHRCGKYDDSDFTANEMCCACGGGDAQEPEPEPEPEPGALNATTTFTTIGVATTVLPRQCPSWLAEGGDRGCRISFLLLPLWLFVNFVGALLLASFGLVRKSDRVALDYAYCFWFVMMLPVHLLLRLVLLAHAMVASLTLSALSGSVVCICSPCGRMSDELVLCGKKKLSCSPLGTPLTDATAKGFSWQSIDSIAFAGLTFGAVTELLWVLLFSGIWVMNENFALHVILVVLVWLAFSVCNPYYSVEFGLHGLASERCSFSWITPSVMNGSWWHLLFAHYALGIHPNRADLEFARFRYRDAKFFAALYHMSFSWFLEQDAPDELQKTLSQGNRSAADLGIQLEPLRGRFQKHLQKIEEALSWETSWRPALSAAGGGLVDVLNDHGIRPSRATLNAAIREAATSPDKRLPISVLAKWFSVSDLRRLRFDWEDVWCPLVVNEDIAFIELLTKHKVYPSTSDIQAGLHQHAPLKSLEPILVALPEPLELANLGEHLTWERDWKFPVMAGRGKLVSLLSKQGVVPSLSVICDAIYASAPLESLSQLLEAAATESDIMSISNAFDWEDTWRDVVLQDTPARAELYCRYGLRPSHQVLQRAIQARPKSACLKPLLDIAAKTWGSLAQCGREFTWKEMWKPALTAGRGDLVEMLAGFLITPSTKAIHEAVFDEIPLHLLGLALASADKGGSTRELGRRLSKEDWEKRIAKNDIPWIEMLCQYGVTPSLVVIEASILSNAPFRILGPLLAAGMPSLKDKLSLAAWHNVAKRDDKDAGAVAKAVVRASSHAPPTSVIVEALSSFANPAVAEALAAGAAGAGSDFGAALPRNVLLELLHAVRLAGEAPVPRGTASRSLQKSARAEELLRTALKWCGPPAPALCTELWDLVVQHRLPHVARILRVNRIGPGGMEPSGRRGSPDENDSEMSGTPSTAATTKTSSHNTPRAGNISILLQEVTKSTGHDPFGTQDQLLHEMVKCWDVRSHLEQTSQSDYQASHKGDVTSLASNSQAALARGIAARLLGRAALREQGCPAPTPGLPAVKPLPDLASLLADEDTAQEPCRPSAQEPCRPSMNSVNDRLPDNKSSLRRPVSSASLYNGKWQRADTGEVVCEIQGGRVEWLMSSKPSASLHVGASGEAVLESNGEICTGSLDDATSSRFVWSNGQIWHRVRHRPIENTSKIRVDIESVSKAALAAQPVVVNAPKPRFSLPRCPPNPAIQEMLDWSQAASGNAEFD